mmetsp:Transcript_26140/g.41048  ORF Transcript_26140/g.41048 Transcript_26140/m.41048 type:complete len:202 (+) Transcript_26140:215-820(+)
MLQLDTSVAVPHVTMPIKTWSFNIKLTARRPKNFNWSIRPMFVPPEHRADRAGEENASSLKHESVLRMQHGCVNLMLVVRIIKMLVGLDDSINRSVLVPVDGEDVGPVDEVAVVVDNGAIVSIDRPLCRSVPIGVVSRILILVNCPRGPPLCPVWWTILLPRGWRIWPLLDFSISIMISMIRCLLGRLLLSRGWRRRNFIR